jgi:site-specific recombinase XerD
MSHKDFGIIQEVVRKFGFRLLTEIQSKDWRDWLDARHVGNLQDSRQRHVNIVRPFLKWCVHEDRGYLPAVPALVDPDAAREKTKRQAPRPRRRVAELRPDLLVFVFGHAHISLRAQLYTEWSTGARVSSIIFGCALGDLVLTDARCQVTFHNTKNGDDVVAKLHPAAVEVLREYLEWRGRLHMRKEPLFLTHHRRPYSRKAFDKGASGFNKTGLNAMKRRAIRALLRASVRARRDGDPALADQLRADARLVRQFTQHWLRHWFATYGRAMQIPRSFIKAQAGWRDDRSIERYEQDVEAMRQQLIAAMPIGMPPRSKDAKKNIV